MQQLAGREFPGPLFWVRQMSALRDPSNPKASRPEGGRPKGSTSAPERAPKRQRAAKNAGAKQQPQHRQQRPKVTDPHETKIIALADSGLTSPEIAAEVGIHPRVVLRLLQDERIRRQAAAKIDPAALSMSARKKLATAIRQHKRELDIEFEIRVLAECKRRLDEISLPHYAKELAALERLIRSRKGVMDRITYRKILACLHPDRVQDPVMKKRYEEAFRLFNELEKRVLDETKSPTESRKMPRTYEELMAMKAKVQAERRAKRAGGKSTVSVR